MKRQLIVVLANRLQCGQDYVLANWDLIERIDQDRARVAKIKATVVAYEASDVSYKPDTMTDLRIVTREEQLRGLEITEIHEADNVHWRLVELAKTRLR